mmetsp:Transcript_25834/g.101901  ORF Transcript_25834/g.101901 Transcript_25834/m.101901 type:complete len:123 (+) Transcript_25834:2827-3195(+)
MGPEELEKGGAETAKEAGKRIENGGRVGQAATAGTGVNPTFKSRRSKPSSDRKLAYARLQGTGRGALDHRVRVRCEDLLLPLRTEAKQVPSLRADSSRLTSVCAVVLLSCFLPVCDAFREIG